MPTIRVQRLRRILKAAGKLLIVPALAVLNFIPSKDLAVGFAHQFRSMPAPRKAFFAALPVSLLALILWSFASFQHATGITAVAASALVIVVYVIFWYEAMLGQRQREVSRTTGLFEHMFVTIFSMIFVVVRVLFGIAAIAGLALLVGLVLLIESTPLIFAWFQSHVPVAIQPVAIGLFTTILGFGIYRFRERHRLWYGIVETTFAVASTWVAANKLTVSAKLEGWLALGAACYLIVRGTDNVHQGAKTSRSYGWIRTLAELEEEGSVVSS